jgi:hypothetical protein
MIGHEAVGEDAHGHTRGCGLQQREKGGIVFRFSKDLGATIAPIDHVVAESPDRGPSGARHSRSLPDAADLINNKVECPLYPFMVT